MLYSALNEFPILAIAAIGFYISLRFLRFPDLSVDASVMFGMSAVAYGINSGFPTEIPSLFIAIPAGFAVGLITAALHTLRAFRMNKFLAGMIVAFASYSICFRICGSSSVSFYPERNSFVFGSLASKFGPYPFTVFIIMFALLVWIFAYRILNTPFGLAIRIAGHRPDILSVTGLSKNMFLVLGMGFANSLIAFSGWLDAVTNLNASLQPFSIIINVLAACLIGDFIRYFITSVFLKKQPHLNRHIGMLLLSPVIGALVFSLLRSFVLKILSGELRIALTTDLNLAVSLCILFVVWAGKRLNNFGEGEEDLDV